MTKTTAILIVGLVVVSASAFGQVSVYSDSDSDAIIFEDNGTTISVEPYGPAYEVTVPSYPDGTSSFYVSPGGYYTRTYEVTE